MLFFSNMNALLLIVLCMGYIVLYFAERSEEGMRVLGYAIGCIAIILTTIYLLGNIWHQAKSCPKIGTYTYEGKMHKNFSPRGMPALREQDR
ncbi:MAG: hypothetical protein FJZ13_02580 [Candidatus Omnitrophica bacterium]|nr:hypothetical protein [Candidatus Omnitrophota bacterium]